MQPGHNTRAPLVGREKRSRRLAWLRARQARRLPHIARRSLGQHARRRGQRMKHSIQDELTDLPLSRQRKYQLRMQRAGRCATCGKPAVPGSRALCREHLTRAREHQRQKHGRKRRYSNALSYSLEPGTEHMHSPDQNLARRLPLQLTFDTDGLEVAVSSSGDADVSRLSLTIALETFLAALSWICASNKVPLAGWLTVGLGARSVLCRVEEHSGDSSSPRLIPASTRMPSVLRGAIQALGKAGSRNGNGCAASNRHPPGHGTSHAIVE